MNVAIDVVQPEFSSNSDTAAVDLMQIESHTKVNARVAEKEAEVALKKPFTGSYQHKRF